MRLEKVSKLRPEGRGGIGQEGVHVGWAGYGENMAPIALCVKAVGCKVDRG